MRVLEINHEERRALLASLAGMYRFVDCNTNNIVILSPVTQTKILEFKLEEK